MKKTMIALALMSIAGTAAANIEMQADVYSGKELVRTYKAVVAEGVSTEIKDKEVAVKFGSKPSPSPEANAPSADLQTEEPTPELGLSLKMTPRKLADGRILIDSAYSITTAMAGMVVHDGVEKEEPITHIRSVETQLVVDEKPGNWPTAFNPRPGELVINFSAKEVL
ncbi:hypothetical protein ABH908_000336 [Pseudomonas frederiksbergensis]|uniref:hypothetical protein n=1 Tax=Pseudomonas TaxID=286 RepID=UPI003D246669